VKRAFWQKVLPLILWMLFAACPAYCSTYFVDPNGNDSNTGDFNHPFKTIPKAVTMVAPGDTIYLRGGTHVYTTTITIDINGTANAR
jgi:pectate disaccharide-lyase